MSIPHAAVAFEAHGMWLIAHTDSRVVTEWYAYEYDEIINLVLYNPTRVRDLIKTFLKKHFTERVVPLTLCFDGPGLCESFSQTQPDTQSLVGCAWQVAQFGGTGFYAAGIPFPVRAQYHLLCMQLPISELRMTSAMMARYQIVKELPPLVSLEAVRQELSRRCASDAPNICPYAYAL